MTKYLKLFLVVMLFAGAYAQTWPTDTIHVNINSGNPKFPFPQFLEYDHGKTLAKYNAEGVTHADMEKAMREGYEIMMHRTLRVPGKVLNGVQYMVYNHSSVPFNNNTFVSEGDGYALLAAAYFADKTTFDGLWMWIHDNRLSKVKKYWDCTNLRNAYRYGANLPGWKNTEGTADNNGDNDSATDGDYDVAMGLLLAWAQWGDNMGVNDGCGTPISYKNEALNMIKALVDTFRLNNLSNAYTGHMSGDIGVDGYVKNGNTWEETTSWRYSAANTTYLWAKPHPEAYNVNGLYTDYIGPAYFRQFAKFLKANGGSPWQIKQFLRGEASSDWLIGQMYAKGYIASSGSCSVNNDGSVTSFGQHPSGAGGEDFRASWRTILNYVWHGNPDSTWNPVTHEFNPVSNTFEYDMGMRHATFLKGPGVPIGTPSCTKLGASPDLSCPDWKGVVNIKQAHLVTGAVGSDNYRTNYNVGTGAPSAVASEDLHLIAEIYRQSEILWDDSDPTMPKTASDNTRYIRSTPKYFHDWFRVLGMLTTSGNLHPPTKMVAKANLKVYMAVDKTYAYVGDELIYTVSYRNYGSVAATTAQITTVIPSEYQVVSGSISGGGTLSAGTITWNIASIPGFQSATGINPTRGSFTFKVKVLNTNSNRVCLISNIAAPNAFGWTSNEFPNNATYTMERNCVDLLANRPLAIDKEVDKRLANPGDVLNFDLTFENKAGANYFLNGGRSRVVVSYGNYFPGMNTFYQFYRIWHTAEEAYINLNNYKVSYYMYDPSIGLYNAGTNPTGWNFSVDNYNDLEKYLYTSVTNPITFDYDSLDKPPGQDAFGKWNQRLMVRFPNTLTSPTTHIYDKLDNIYLIHKGVIGPAFIRTKLESTPPTPLGAKLADDWSYSNAVDIGKIDGQDQRLTPITNSWADPYNLNVPVNNYSVDVCNANVTGFNRLLVEEYDGYTWRRIAGNAPVPGRDANYVVVHDTLPAYLNWIGFTDNEAMGVIATYTAATRIIEWKIPAMYAGSKGTISYQATPNGTCPGMADRNFINSAWIWSSTDSKISDTVKLKSTCAFVPPYVPVTTMTKTASAATVLPGNPVTYTIAYQQTHGTIETDNFSAQTDWVAPSGSPGLPSPMNNTNSPYTGTGKYFYDRYSHGTNGLMKFKIDLNGNAWPPFTMLLRWNGLGQPGTAAFNGIAVTVWAGQNGIGGGTKISIKNDNNAPFYTTPSLLSYTNPQATPEFTIALNGNRIRIWVNAADTINSLPLIDVTGVKVQAGYLGYYNNPADGTIGGGTLGDFRLLNWYTHFDSAFNLQISDPLPANLTYVSNTGGGTNAAGTVTWPLQAGPVLYGTTYSHTVTANVATCPASGSIVNTAYTNMVGQATNSIAAQAVIGCVSAVPTNWLSFEGKRNGITNTLSWITINESNCERYEVQRSLDGVSFHTVGIVTCNNSALKSNYSYQEEISAGNVYYRLAQVDFNEETSYSRIIRLGSEGSVQVVPNPFKDKFRIENNTLDVCSARLNSSTGAELGSFQVSSNESLNIGEELAPGIYFVEVQYAGTVKVYKLIKQ